MVRRARRQLQALPAGAVELRKLDRLAAVGRDSPHAARGEVFPGEDDLLVGGPGEPGDAARADGQSVVRLVPSTSIFFRVPSGAPKAIHRPSGENSGNGPSRCPAEGCGQLVHAPDVDHPAAAPAARHVRRLPAIGRKGEVGRDAGGGEGEAGAGWRQELEAE